MANIALFKVQIPLGRLLSYRYWKLGFRSGFVQWRFGLFRSKSDQTHGLNFDSAQNVVENIVYFSNLINSFKRALNSKFLVRYSKVYLF